MPNTNSGGANANKQYWVVQESAGSGAYFSDQLRTGSYNGPTGVARQLGYTPTMSPNTTIPMPRVGNAPSADLGSFGAVANSLNNLPLVSTCTAGLKVAIVMDLSDSVSSSQRTTFRNAIVGTNGLFDSLMNTNSSIAVFTFGMDSPAGGTLNYPAPMALTAANRNTLNGRINTATNGTQGTNWDRALRTVATANATHGYDLVLMVTDGAPNVIAASGGSGYAQVNSYNVTQRSLEAAIYSANAIKKDTRLVAIGVGNAISGDVTRNLRAISGPTLNNDYFTTASWDLLNTQLKNIASAATCQVPITITKLATDINGQNPTPDSGWTVSATPGNPSEGNANLTPAQTSQVTGSGTNAPGQATWVLAMTNEAATISLSVAEQETSKPNYAFDSGECVISHVDGTTTTLDMTGPTLTLSGLVVNDNVACTFTNRATPASLQVDKRWVINGSIYTHAEATSVLAQFGASASPVVSPLPSGATAAFGSVINGYPVGTNVTVNEELSLGMCTLVSKHFTTLTTNGPLPAGGTNVQLPAGKTTVTLTNTVVCGATLQLVKEVHNTHGGTANPSQWTLSAIKAGGSTNLIDVVSGTAAASRSVDPGTYVISETGSAAYDWTSLTCTNRGVPMTGPNLQTKSVTLAAGDRVVCTLGNSDRPLADLQVTKSVAGTMTRTYEWSVEKTAASKVVTVDPSTGKATVGYSVTATPSAPIDSGWALTGTITVTNPNTWQDVTVTVIDQPSLGGDAQCTVLNGRSVIPKGGSVVFDYSCTFGSKPSYTGRNVATVTWDRPGGGPGVATAAADITAATWTTTVVNGTATITDDHHTFDPAWVAQASAGAQSKDYSIEWTVAEAGTCKDFDNTAALTGSNGFTTSDTERIKACRGADLSVTKNVVNSLDRSYLWDIVKEPKGDGFIADPATGEVSVTYDVTVTPTGHTDSNWAMNGEITVANPNDWQDVAATVTDEVSLGTGATCAVTGVKGDAGAVDADPARAGFQYTIPRSSSVVFTYSCSFTGQPNYTGTNTAGVEWDRALAHTPTGSATKAVDVQESGWSQKPINDSVTVTDDHYTFEPAWVVNASDGEQKRTYTVKWVVEDAGQCASFSNTASLTGSDGLTDSSTATIDACRAADLTVTKTIEAELIRSYGWSVAKSAKGTQPYSVDPATGKVTVDYEVIATASDGVDSDWLVSGTISVTNPNTWQAVSVTPTDSIGIGGGATCTVLGVVDAQGVVTPLNGPVSVPASGTVKLAYECAFTGRPAYAGTNTATVAWDRAAAHTAGASASGTASLVESDWQVTTRDATATLTDDHVSEPWTASVAESPVTKSYSVTWEVGAAGTCKDFDNTAALTGSDGFTTSDTERITACRGGNLTASITRAGTFERWYDWTIDKVSDEGPFYTDAQGDVKVGYTVAVEPTGHADEKWAGSGSVTVTNPNGFADVVATVSVSDDLGGGSVCTVAGPDADPATPGVQILVPKGASATRGYTCTYPTQPAYAGTATAVITWDKAPIGSPSGTATATQTITEAEWVVAPKNDTITVADSELPEPWVVNLADGRVEKTYDLTWTIGEAGTCKEFPNVATLTGDDGLTKSADETIEACRGANLTVDKVAVSSFDRSYLWDIVKTPKGDGPFAADPETGKVTVGYDVTLTPSGHTDSGWIMTGKITVSNPNQWQDIPATITDEVSLGAGATCTVTGVTDDRSAADADPEKAGYQAVIPKGATVEFDYVCSFTQAPNYSGSNLGKVEWDAATAHTPTGVATKTFEVKENYWSQTPINDTVTVTDTAFTFDPEWTVSVSDGEQKRSYEVTWTVDEAGTCKEFPNTAAAISGDSVLATSSATITACRQADLTVTKEAWGSYERAYQWSVEKTLADGQQAEVTADAAGTATIDYQVDVSVAGHQDSGWQAFSLIAVTNPNDFMPVRATVGDTISKGQCVADWADDVDPETPGVQVDVPAGSTMRIYYRCDFESLEEADYAGAITNTVTVTWEGGEASSEPVPIEFTSRIRNAVVDVYDDQADPSGEPAHLGQVSLDEAPASFPYSLTFTGIDAECEVVTNTATVTVPAEVIPTLMRRAASDAPGVVVDSSTAEATICPQVVAPLSGTLDGSGSFDRAYDWKITKAVDQTTKSVVDSRATFTYVVEAIPAGSRDSGHAAKGSIELTNPNEAAVAVTVGELSGPEGMTCQASAADADPKADGTQVIVPASGKAEVAFDCTGTPTTTEGAKARAKLTYTDARGTARELQVTGDIAFTLANETDREVTVYDDKTTPDRPRVVLGTAVWNEAGTPTRFTYSLVLALQPGKLFSQFTNTAQIGKTGPKASVTVTVTGKKPGPPKTGH